MQKGNKVFSLITIFPAAFVPQTLTLFTYIQYFFITSTVYSFFSPPTTPVHCSTRLQLTLPPRHSKIRTKRIAKPPCWLLLFTLFVQNLPHGTSLLKCLGVHSLLSAALCLSSPLCRSSSLCLCSVASSMFPSFSDLVTCCHNRLRAQISKLISVPNYGCWPRKRVYSPGFCPPLFVHRLQLLPDHGKFGRVDHFGLPAAVGELQRSVPLALGFTDDGVGRVVFDFCRHSAGKTETLKTPGCTHWDTFTHMCVSGNRNTTNPRCNNCYTLMEAGQRLLSLCTLPKLLNWSVKQ